MNILKQFLHLYLKVSTYLVVTLLSYDPFSNRLIVHGTKWYRYFYKIRLCLCLIASLVSVGQAAYFHLGRERGKSQNGAAHTVVMLHATFFIMSHFAFCRINKVHLEKMKEMANIFNAMAEFEERYGTCAEN